MKRGIKTIGSLLLLSLAMDCAWCISPEQQLALLRLARQEQERTRALPAGEAERLARECRAALQQLNRHFAQAHPRDRARWERGIDRDELADELKSSQPDAQRLLVLSKQFYAPHEGLELAPAIALRSALDNYVDFQLLNRSPDDLQQERAIRLQRVSRILEAGPRNETSLREEASWLATLEQSPPLIAELQKEFKHPNLIFTIAPGMLPAFAEKFQREVDHSRWSANFILGNRVEGMAHFRGKITSRPATQQANAIELALTGQIHSPHNTAYAGRFQVYSQGQTSVQAKLKVHWDGTKLTAEPAKVSAQTNSTLIRASVDRRRLLPRSRLANRIDNRIESAVLSRASESLPQARREAASLAAARIANSFNGEIQERLTEWNRNVQHYYTHPLVRVGMLPKSSASLTEAGATLQFQFPGRSGLAAATPPDLSLQGDINVCIHESAFPNLIQRFAGGGIWRDDFFAHIQKEALGDNEVELRIRESSDRWSVQFDRINPWSTRIDRDGVHFTMSVTTFWIDGRERTKPFILQCTLAPFEDVGTKYGWRRVGDVSITGDLDSHDREFLRRKFAGFFASEFHLDGLSSPAGGAWDYLSNVRLYKLELTHGWLGMEFRRLPDAENVAIR